MIRLLEFISFHDKRVAQLVFAFNNVELFLELEGADPTLHVICINVNITYSIRRIRNIILHVICNITNITITM